MTASSLSLDTVLDLLSNRRRRFAIAVLARHAETMTLADLADEVAELEHDVRIEEIPADAVMNVYLSLYQNHVPRLEAADIVTYCQEHDLVAVGDNLDQFGPLLPGVVC